MSRTFRGAVSGSGLFRGFGRQVAFASTAFLGGAGLVEGLKSSVSAASDLHEAVTKTNVVFEQNAQQIEEWSKTTAKSMGLARAETLETASSFGALFRPLGISGKLAAEQSQQLTRLGADLASFYNTDVKDALDAITSGIVGQSRPLRRYGVLLSESRVQQEALRETGKKHAKDLTDQEKVLARIAIIYHDTALAQGDFQRTSGGLANQQRILRANLANVREELGTALLPFVNQYVRRLNAWFGNEQNVHNLTRRFTAIVRGLGRAVDFTRNMIDRIVSSLGGWKSALGIIIGAWAGFKVAGVGSAAAVEFANISAAAGTAAAWRTALITTGWGAFAIAAGIAAGYVITHWEKVKAWFQEFWIWLQETADKTALKVIEPFSHIPEALGVHIGTQARKAKDALKRDLGDLEREAGKAAERLSKASQPKRPEAPKIPGAPPLPKFPRVPGVGTGGGGGATAGAGKVTGFTVPFRFQLAQAQAELTKSIADNVRVARQVAAFIRSKLPSLHGQKLLDAYQQLAAALGTIRDAASTAAEAAQAAAAKAKERAAAAAAKAKAAAAAARQFSVPLALEVAQSRAAALGKSLRPILRAIRASAERALKSGRLGLQGMKDAYDTITGVNQELSQIGKKTKRSLAGFTGLGSTMSSGLTRMGTPLGIPVPGVFTRLAHDPRLLPGSLRPTIEITGGIHLHGVQNVRELEDELAKRSRARPKPRRGP